MTVDRLFCAAALGICLAAGPLASSALASRGIPVPSVTAARPGEAIAGKIGTVFPSQRAAMRYQSLTTGEGAGKNFCATSGGHPLGADFDDVYVCGPSTGTADDFDTVGFQCVELSERFLWVVYGDFIPAVEDGKDLVADGSSALGLQIGTPAVDSLPVAGDVVSMWGDPGSEQYGHTAVVTSVSVDAAGNGTIEIMEENGSSAGWDQINVTNWSEAYGDPSWDDGFFYYDHIEWLELQPNPPELNDSPIQFKVQGLGSGTVATAINESGTVAGYINHQSPGIPTRQQPFLVNDNTWTYPSTPSSSVHLVAINDRGAVAAWAHGPDAQPVGYALHSVKPTRWSVLPLPSTGVTADQTTSIDSWGDVSGWLSTKKVKTPTTGAVWVRSPSSYVLKALTANKYFASPMVLQADHAGDAVGSETLRTTNVYAVVWAPWGKAYRLPGLSRAFVNSTARAMAAATHAGVRTLTVVGASTDDTGTSQAVEWTIRLTGHTLRTSAPVELSTTPWSGPSSALAINSSGWVIGSLGLTGTSDRSFVYRPSFGMADLQTLLPAGSPWVVQNVSGINSAGIIVGQGYDLQSASQGTSRGIILSPFALPDDSIS